MPLEHLVHLHIELVAVEIDVLRVWPFGVQNAVFSPQTPQCPREAVFVEYSQQVIHPPEHHVVWRLQRASKLAYHNCPTAIGKLLPVTVDMCSQPVNVMP